MKNDEVVRKVRSCDHCTSPAMVNRLPNRTTTKFIHLLCWPCAREFYFGPPSRIVQAALADYFAQVGGSEAD